MSGSVVSILIFGNSGYTNNDSLEAMFNSLNGCSTVTQVQIITCHYITTIHGISKLKNSKINLFRYLRNSADDYYDFDISDLENFNSEEGYISELKMEDVKIDTLPNLSGLKLNSLTLNNLSIENIDGLKNCTTLTELDLSNNKIQNLDSIKNLSNLKTLNLSVNNLYNTYKDPVKNETINNLKILSDLHGRGLKSLDVSKNHFEETGNSEDLLKKLKELFGSNGDFSNQI